MTNVLCGRLATCEGPKSLLFYFNSGQREIAVRSLERVNMLHRAKQRADRLSGGEKQRVAIARAVAQQPKLLLADEPVASLDPELAVQVMEDLARVARDEGVPTLINIHHVDLARMFCDRVVGIANGRRRVRWPRFRVGRRGARPHLPLRQGAIARHPGRACGGAGA